MGLIDSIIGAESGGNPNATNPNSSASGLGGSPLHVGQKLRADPRIGELFFAGRPSAVFRRVIAIGFTVDRVVPGRLLAHVSQKRFKAVAPTIANFDASLTVERVGNVPRILAPVDHGAPRVVFRRGLAAPINRNRSAVRRVGLLRGLDLVATAAKRIARLKISDSNRGFGAAVALADHSPHLRAAVFSDLRFGFGSNDKFSKSHPNVIFARHYGSR